MTVGVFVLAMIAVLSIGGWLFIGDTPSSSQTSVTEDRQSLAELEMVDELEGPLLPSTAASVEVAIEQFLSKNKTIYVDNKNETVMMSTEIFRQCGNPRQIAQA